MVEGPFGNIKIDGPFEDNNIWVIATLNSPDVGLEGLKDTTPARLEEKAKELKTHEGEGQAFAFERAKGRINVYYRTFWTDEQNADIEMIGRDTKKLRHVPTRNHFDIERTGVSCGRPSKLDEKLGPTGPKFFTEARGDFDD